MVKLLYIFSTLESSGPIKVHFDIIKNLPQSIFQVRILTLSEEPEKSLVSLYKGLGISLECLNLNRNNWFTEGIRKVNNFIGAYKPDILHTQGIRADFLAAYFIKHPIKFSTLHNFPYQEYTFTYGKIKGTIMAFVHLKALSKINFPIVPSKSNQIQIYKASRLEFNIILNGIDSKIFKPVDRATKADLRQKLGLPENKVVFVSIGQLTSRKDPLTIINAFKKANLSNGCLLILGKGDLEAACLSAAVTHENIKVLGYKENISDYIQASDYYISASKAEGLPLSVLEALGTGVPVILSNIMPHEEILSFNSKAGYLIETGNEAEFAKVLQEIATVDYDTLSAEARKIVRMYLNDEIMAIAYQKLYLQSLGR
jgi:glycosyltransferase involved in cell wall biosynthesis